MTINAIQAPMASNVSFGKKHVHNKSEEKHSHSMGTTAKVAATLTGLAALGAASVLMYKKSGAVKKIVNNAVDKVKNKFAKKTPNETALNRLNNIKKMDQEIRLREARVSEKMHNAKQKVYEEMFASLPESGKLFEKELPVSSRQAFLKA